MSGAAARRAGGGPPFRLEVCGLEIRSGRDGPPVVSEISFAVRPGEVLGLVGESGSGKTTVALALLGHTRRGLTVSAGQIRVDGVDLLRLSPAALRQLRGARVSYVPQDPAAALNPALRIGYQLREALRGHASREHEKNRALEVLGEVRLEATPDMLRRYPHQLSGGQQQRVALAMAFSCRPSLIVLDEPTTGLDVSTQRHILDTVRRLCRVYGVAAVYVSHDLAVVSELASGVAVMYAGRIVEAGPAAMLFGHPLHPYTQGLLASVPVPEGGQLLAGHTRPAAAARVPRRWLLLRSPLRPRAGGVPGARAGAGAGRRTHGALPARGGRRGAPHRVPAGRGRSGPAVRRAGALGPRAVGPVRSGAGARRR